MSLWRFGVLLAAAHAQTPCVTKTTLSPGDGVTFPQPGDTVSMHYTGTLASTGAKFDSSRDRGKEFSTQIGVGQVIQGWDQGVPQMSLGEHAILRISAACGYGAQGSPPVIPPNADLVFDVQLNGLNGRRASTPAAPVASMTPAASITTPIASASLTFGASSMTPAAAPVAKAPPAALPTCIPSSCGHAISFDTTGNSRPLCLCNPICQQWATTAGILPCCPGLQQVCLDPYRSPSPQPPAAPAASITASVAAAIPAVTNVLPAASITAAIPALPTCRPNSCAKAMASAANPTVAVCACDASCLSAGSTLPCCQQFQEVCQAPAPAAIPAAVPSPTPKPVVQATTMAAQSSTSAQVTATQPATKQVSAACAVGHKNWDEQQNCDKKRWAIQNNKCKKVCPAVDTTLGIKYYPTGQPGKNACAAALAACKA